jgi:hypothetical protein
LQYSQRLSPLQIAEVFCGGGTLAEFRERALHFVDRQPVPPSTRDVLSARKVVTVARAIDLLLASLQCIDRNG